MNKDLWVFKYAPKILDEMIVTPEKKEKLQKIIDEIPNTLIAGKPGTGKGTFMDILLKETGCNCLKINASMENSVDDVREKISKFAKAYDPDNVKVVYLNESCRLSAAGQDALRQLLEDTEKITRFFFVANNENKITDALKSRCGYHLDLNDPPGKSMFYHCVKILKKEGIELKNKKGLVEMVSKLYPDIRKIIGTMQSNVKNGVIESISYGTNSDLYEQIFSYMKNSDIENIRKTLRSNYVDYPELYSHLYSKAIDDPDCVNSPGSFIIETGEALFRDSQVAISEVNFVSYFFKLMEKQIV